MRRLTPDTLTVFVIALLVFGTSVTDLRARPTDISALRVLAGDVPYRDFWTMYAPGSYVTLAAVFAVVGRELIVSNLLGILASASAVVVFHRVARPAVGAGAAFWLSGLVTLAFFGTGYHNGFTSYPPALLLILLGVAAIIRRCDDPGWHWALVPGAALGTAALFKHDIAAYATLAAGAGTLVVRYHIDRHGSWWPAVAALGVAAAAVPLTAACVLLALGAGPDLWEDLVRFPAVDFKHLRGEYFPIIPQLRDTTTANILEARQWAICNLPTLGVILGIAGLRGRWQRLDEGTRFLFVCAVVAFAFHWVASHVQINTNAISLALWGSLAGGIGARAVAPRYRYLMLAVVLAWGALFIGPPVQRWRTFPPSDTWANLPGLSGIRVPADSADRWHQLSRAIADAAPPDAPLLFVSRRNDVSIHAQSIPFWLSPRRPATRHHEIHPGVTDIPRMQRRMLEDLEAGPLPVVVREHRFDDDALATVKADFLPYVPVGSRLLDDWIAERYESGMRYGAYEVMRPRPKAP